MEGRYVDKITDSLLLAREHETVAPDEVIHHITTNMKSRVKLSDNSHRNKVWTPDMMFYYVNLILDKFVPDPENNSLGLFKNASSYGPKQQLKVTFHPFTWSQNWHLAIAFHEIQNIVIVNCTGDKELLYEEGVGAFPINLTLKLEEFIIYFGHRVNKSALKRPRIFQHMFEPASNINAINVLALVYSFCISEDKLTRAFCDPDFLPRKFDITEFFHEIKAFDRFGFTRAVLGNIIVNKMIEKANGKPAASNIIGKKREHDDKENNVESPSVKRQQVQQLTPAPSENDLQQSQSQSQTTPQSTGNTSNATADALTTAATATTTDTPPQTSVAELSPIVQSPIQGSSKPSDNEDIDELFPLSVAENFIERLTDLEEFEEDLEVIDEVVEMLEGLCHNKKTNPKAKHTDPDYKKWPIVVREHLFADYIHKHKLEFDEDEGKDIISQPHQNEIFPLILANGAVFLVNIRTSEHNPINTKVNVIEISDRPTKNDRDILKSAPLKKLIELHGWQRHKFVARIHASKINIKNLSGYNILVYALYCLHHFALHEKFSLNFQPNPLDVDNYGIILQKLMYDIKDGKKAERDQDFQRLLKYVR